MRNLTITRRKSYVGCIVKDKVYIRDEVASEITIDGVPCRKIGELKNGETKTFQIGEGEQQIFLIADKMSKDYCNATVTVPAGQEDVALSGVHKFVFGSNPFQFDGVQQTAQQLAKQKKNGRKGTVIMIGAIVLGLAIGLFLPNGLLGTPAKKTFTKEDFRITLTEEFEAKEEEGFLAAYSSKKAMVFTARDSKTLFDNITLEEYCDFVVETNGRTGAQVHQEDDFRWFEYTETVDGQAIYYLVVCCESEDAFWIVNFATPATNQGKFKETFFDWARTIQVG